MKNFVKFSIVMLWWTGTDSAYGETWGEKPSIPIGEQVSLTEAVAKSQTSKSLLISGKVEKVCKKKGCWMGITDGKHTARVTFKDYGFFVKPDLVGKDVVVQGQLEVKKMSLEETMHYMKDAGKTDKELVGVTPRTEYRVVASGVALASSYRK